MRDRECGMLKKSEERRSKIEANVEKSKYRNVEMRVRPQGDVETGSAKILSAQSTGQKGGEVIGVVRRFIHCE